MVRCSSLERIAAQTYAVGHVAAMPDLHVAHGVAVGTVFATDGALVPSALGGDLGCGVTAVQLAPSRTPGTRGFPMTPETPAKRPGLD